MTVPAGTVAVNIIYEGQLTKKNKPFRPRIPTKPNKGAATLAAFQPNKCNARYLKKTEEHFHFRLGEIWKFLSPNSGNEVGTGPI